MPAGRSIAIVPKPAAPMGQSDQAEGYVEGLQVNRQRGDEDARTDRQQERRDVDGEKKTP